MTRPKSHHPDRSGSVLRATMLWMSLSVAQCFAGSLGGDAGLIYGPGHTYWVAAPEGWVLNLTAGRAHGMLAVFYRDGETWDTATAFMYVRTAVPDSGEVADHLMVAREDSIWFARESREVSITGAGPIKLKNGQQAPVYHFSGSIVADFEAAAYIPEATITPIVVLAAPSLEVFEQALPAFEQLVQSYEFLTKNVRLPSDSPKVTGDVEKP